MYISFLLMARLFILPFSYMLAIVVFWKDIGSLILLLGVIPLIINTILFSYPLYNYISMLVFTFLIFHIMKIPGDYVFYETTFWGVQATWIAALISTVIFKKIFVPFGSVKRRRELADFFHNRDNEVVVFDCRHGSISSITQGALRFYGWKKQKLLNYSLLRLHVQDFINNPPVGFWETLEKGHAWHGFLDVRTKNGDIYEERACYRAYKNSDGEIEKIEKKIIEVLYKEINNTTYEHYKIFFDQSPVMMAVLNSMGIIEYANTSFMTEIPIKPNFFESFFSELFPIDMQIQIYQTLSEVVASDKKKSFSASFKGNQESFSAQFCFLPYKYVTDKNVSKILFMLYPDPVCSEIVQKEIVDNVQIVSVTSMLKDVLTQIYKEYQKPLLKLMSGSLPSIRIQYSLWYDFFYCILTLVLQQNSLVENKVTVTSSLKEGKKYLFRIFFQGSNYQQLYEQINANQCRTHISENSSDMKESLEKFAENFEIINEGDDIMIINFEFQEK